MFEKKRYPETDFGLSRLNSIEFQIRFIYLNENKNGNK